MSVLVFMIIWQNKIRVDCAFTLTNPTHMHTHTHTLHQRLCNVSCSKQFPQGHHHSKSSCSVTADASHLNMHTIKTLSCRNSLLPLSFSNHWITNSLLSLPSLDNNTPIHLQLLRCTAHTLLSTCFYP